MTGGTRDACHLLTARLDLQALTARDLRPLHQIMSDPRNCVHIPEGPKESPEDSQAWIERFGLAARIGVGQVTSLAVSLVRRSCLACRDQPVDRARRVVADVDQVIGVGVR